MLTFPLTDTCELRLLEESDAAELYELVDRNRAYLARWMPWAEGQTLEGALGFIRATRKQVADNHGFQTAIMCDGRLVGVVGFHGVAWQHSAAGIGYWLSEDHQGRGLMTRAVEALADHAIREWGLRRIEIRVAVDNRRSRAVPERLGFREEGVLRDGEKVGDAYFDIVVYSMLAADWVGRADRLAGRS